MRGPPDGQKERQQQAIQVSPILNPTGLKIETTTFAVLEGRFYAHAPGIDLNLSAPGALIADKQPRLLTLLVPHETDVRFQGLLLPDPGFAIPVNVGIP